MPTFAGSLVTGTLQVYGALAAAPGQEHSGDVEQVSRRSNADRSRLLTVLLEVVAEENWLSPKTAGIAAAVRRATMV
jgi:hypothetical protein